MLHVGGSVERYVVEQVLGEGGMAVVYRVRHGTLGTLHALKVLSVTSRGVRERLIQEGRVQATLQHPNVVAVTDVLDVNDAQGLLMEYVCGPSLDRLLAAHRLELDDALALFRGICAGVAHAHTRGLVHRDLKPANVMLQVTDAGVVPKVTDFGLAKALDVGSSHRTRTGTTMGTPAYMPPEQIRDASKVDRRADMYALGCILYELVCGRPPFDGDDLMALFAAIGAGRHPHPRELAPELPDAVVAAIEGLLAVDATERIPDCAALAEVLAGRTPETPRLAVPLGEMLPPAPPLALSFGATYLSADTALATLARDLAPSALDLAPVEPSGEATSGETWLGHTLGPAPAEATLAPTAPPPRPGPPRRIALPLVGGAALLLGGALVGAVIVAAIAGVLVSLWGADPTASTSTDAALAPVPEATAAPDPAQPPEPTEAPEPVDAPEPVGDPAPVDAPEPVGGSARVDPPAPETAPQTPAPAPVAPQGATFTFDEATLVYLESSDGHRYRRGDLVPPGTYRILAVFPGAAAPTGAGQITVVAGEHVTLRCSPRAQQCRK